ncbi:MAG: hypothetical protein AAFV53_05220 [Myxococcota bacterium]
MFLFLFSLSASAADWSAVQITAFNEATAVPYTRLPVTELHPGLAVSASIFSKERGAFSWSLDAELGGYHNDQVETAMYLLPSWRPTWWLHRAIGLTGMVGLGYKHAFYPQPTYMLEEGEYVRQSSWGHPEATAQIGTGLTIRTSDHLAIVAQYRGSLDGPFSSSLGMPVLMHARVHLGLEMRR